MVPVSTVHAVLTLNGSPSTVTLAHCLDPTAQSFITLSDSIHPRVCVCVCVTLRLRAGSRTTSSSSGDTLAVACLLYTSPSPRDRG
eukprot:563449-Rhodomonas_salina.1